MHHAQPELEAVGVDLVVIGNGGPSFIEGFREKSGYDGPLYTDPSRRTYRALGFRRGVSLAFNLQSARLALEAFREGHRQGITRGDNWQQGGVLVVDTAGEVAYAYVAERAGDHPATAEILAAARLVSRA